MALKKTIAGYRRHVDVNIPVYDMRGEIVVDPDGHAQFTRQKEVVDIPQLDIEMHPLEEAEILATWAVGDVIKKIPVGPTMIEEQEMLIEHGAEYVKQKRSELLDIQNSFAEELIAEKAKQQEASEAYVLHMQNGGADEYKLMIKNNEDNIIQAHVQKINDDINVRVLQLREEYQAELAKKEAEKEILDAT